MLTMNSGASVAGTMWFALFTSLLTRRILTTGLPLSIPVLIIAYTLLSLFVAIIIFAYPALRFKSHNTFEHTHRYAGWLAVALFWAELILLAESTRLTSSTPTTPTLLNLSFRNIHTPTTYPTPILNPRNITCKPIMP